MALVPVAQPVPAGIDSSLVPYGSSGDVGEPLESRLAKLRANREAHSRKQIWTKDAHGGPYRKVNVKTGYDPLVQLPDGTERKAELGYERVKIGPTTNFVGNHMTQGAIDLVQAQLEGPAEATPPPLLLGAAAAATAAAAGPCLVRAGPAAALAAPVPPRPVQQYSWDDAGGTVHVDVPVAQLWLGLRGNTKAEVCCEITSDRMDLLIQEAPPLPVAQPAADAEEFSFSPGGGSAGGKGASGSGAAPSGPLHQLHLHPLSAPVVPTLCRCFVRGPPALLPCSSSGSLGGGGEEAQPEGQDKPAQEAAQLLSIRFCLPRGAEALVVELAKADPTQQWEALQAAPALPLARATSSPAHPSDLTGLRKALRRQLGRSAAAPPAPAVPCPASPCDDARLPAAAPDTTSSMLPPPLTTTLLQQAEALVAAGQHAGALELTAAWQAHQAGQAPVAGPAAPLAAQLHGLRARCHVQLGSLKLAAPEFTAAICLQGSAAGQTAEAEPGLGGEDEAQRARQMCQLLLSRSSVYEQQEQLEAALVDAEHAGRLQRPPSAAALLTAQRLRQACRIRRVQP